MVTVLAWTHFIFFRSANPGICCLAPFPKRICTALNSLLQYETVIQEETRILVFGPSSWPELLKPLQFCKLLSSKGASVLIFGLWPQFLIQRSKSLGIFWVIGMFCSKKWLLVGSWMGAGYLEDQTIIRSSELSAPPHPLGRRVWLEIELTINHTYMMKRP